MLFQGLEKSEGRRPGIEPGTEAPQASVLPLHYHRRLIFKIFLFVYKY